MGAAFSFLHFRGNAGQVTPLADAAAECGASTLDGFPDSTSGTQDRRYACGPPSPHSCGHLKGSIQGRQVWDGHSAGYLDPAGLGLSTGPLPTSASCQLAGLPSPSTGHF